MHSFNIMHLAAKTCTSGAGYTLNFKHCVCMKNFLIDQTQRQYSGHNIPLSHRTDTQPMKISLWELKTNCIKKRMTKSLGSAMCDFEH